MPIVRIPCVNPGCGSDLIYDDVTLINARTGKPAYIRPWTLQAALLMASCLSLALAQLLRPEAIRLSLDIVIVIAFAALSLLSLAVMTKPAVVARLVPTVRLHSYTCQICGYKWQANENAGTTSGGGMAALSRRATEGAQFTREDRTLNDQRQEKQHNVEPIAE